MKSGKQSVAIDGKSISFVHPLNGVDILANAQCMATSLEKMLILCCILWRTN